MSTKSIIGILAMTAAFLGGLGQPGHAQEPPAEEPAKKEVPAIAKEIVKMEVLRRANEKGEVVPLTRKMIEASKKTIEDKEKIGQLLAIFPEVGTDQKPDATLPGDGRRLYGAAYQITLHREKGDPLLITVSSNREFWCWSKGNAVSNGDWNLKKPKEVEKFLDALIESAVKKEVPALAKEVVKMKVVRVTNEQREDDRAEKTIEDKEKIGQLLALFPEVGTDQKPDNVLARASGAAYQIALEREKGEPLYITISSNRQFWVWSQGTALPKGDWNLKQAKEVGKFLDELLK